MVSACRCFLYWHRCQWMFFRISSMRVVNQWWDLWQCSRRLVQLLLWPRVHWQRNHSWTDSWKRVRNKLHRWQSGLKPAIPPCHKPLTYLNGAQLNKPKKGPQYQKIAKIGRTKFPLIHFFIPQEKVFEFCQTLTWRAYITSRCKQFHGKVDKPKCIAVEYPQREPWLSFRVLFQMETHQRSS